METIFEGIMLGMFCIAIFILICRFAQNKTGNLKAERGIAYTMGIGFVIGTIREILTSPVRWIFLLYVLGAFLSYFAVVFSYPQIGKSEESEEINK